MGYLRIEQFDDTNAWAKEIPDLDVDDPSYVAPFYTLQVNDWPDNLTEGKSTGIRVLFDGNQASYETYFYRQYREPKWFKFKDGANRDFSYDALIFTYCFRAAVNARFGKADDFYFSLSIHNEGELLREWFIPASPGGCDYDHIKLDLKPLVEAGFDRFDEVRIHILKHPGFGAKLYLGDLWFFGDEVVHNTSVAIATMLHNKIRKRITSLSKFAQNGARGITVWNQPDIFENAALIIGDPEGDYELHSVTGIDYNASQETVFLKFTNEYDGEKLIGSWAEETPVYLSIPAEFGELRDDESVFPKFYVALESPVANEQFTKMGYTVSNYVRDPDGDHKVAYHLAEDAIEIPVSIYVFAQNPELASEMWRFLRKVMNSQSLLNISGIACDYEIAGERSIPPDEAGLPYYVMEMTVYAFENVHELTYANFSGIKLLTTATDPVNENVSGLNSVEIFIQKD